MHPPRDGQAYRVGILGFGFIGKVHAYAYDQLPWCYEPLPYPVQLARVCTSRPETAAAAAALTGAEPTTDAAAVLADPTIDIVNICTPNDLHRDQLLAAMADQKHIYCDKPLVADATEAAAIRAALPAYTGVAQMTFNNRFSPAMQRARELIDAGAVGRVLEFRVSYLHASNVDPTVPLKWKMSGASGGGVIADLASHSLDLAQWLLGDFSEVMAATHIAYPDRPSLADPRQRVPVDAEDNVWLLARLPHGAIGTIGASKLTTGAEDEVRVEIHGEAGGLRYNSMDPHHLQVYDASGSDQPHGGMRGWTHIDCGQRFPAPALKFPGPKQVMGWLRIHTAAMHAFMTAVTTGRPADPGLEQGLKVQSLMHACRVSARDRRWVTPE